MGGFLVRPVGSEELLGTSVRENCLICYLSISSENAVDLACHSKVQEDKGTILKPVILIYGQLE